MSDLSRPVSGSQPDPEPTASSAPSGSAAAVRVCARPEDRRRYGPPPSADAERDADEHTLIELRRKVQNGELLSASTERLLWRMRFNGHLTVVVQNGRVVKSGYEEGYFRRRNDLGGFLLES